VFRLFAHGDSTVFNQIGVESDSDCNTQSGSRMVALSGKILQDMRSPDLVKIRYRLPLAFGSIAQALDPIMGRFNLGKLTGNKLLS